MNASLIEVYKGPLSIWERPKGGEDYAIGVDSAEGVRGGDYCAAAVIKMSDCALVATIYGHIETKEWGRKCARLAWHYNEALLAFETYPTAHGLTAARAALEYGYPRLYHRIKVSNSVPQPTEKLGWHTDRESGPRMVTRVREALAEGYSIPSRVLFTELRGMKYDDSNKVETDGFKDLADAYAIALCARDEAYVRQEVRTAPKLLEEHERIWEEVEAKCGRRRRPELIEMYDGGLE